MLAQIRNSRFFRAANLALLAGAALTLGSCATKQPPPLVSDGSGRESQLPWNKQEKWESTGQAGALADQLQSR